MKLVGAKIENFRCYRQETAIGIDDLTVLIGKRDAGKSSILDALAIFFDEEVLKLNRWADDLKLGLERELKEIDKEIKEAQRAAQMAVSLAVKLAVQKRLRQIEDKRNRKRRELYNGQDRIDEQRDELIRRIERQLEQLQHVQMLFIVRLACI